MKELIGTARNVFMRKTSDEVIIPHMEIVIITSEPTFRSIEGVLVREVAQESFRCVISAEGMKTLIASFTDYLAELTKVDVLINETSEDQP